MPWELQVCRFCGKGYAHKTGLRNHLSQYVGKWRLPADGIHDVLEIQGILYPDADHREYRCPSRDCRTIIATRQKFTEHVITKAHWGAFPERPLRGLLGSKQDTDEESIDLSTISEWVLPFDEEAVKVFEPEGTFPFLLLPPELRLMIYEFTLCFSGIQFVSMDEMRPSTRKGKGKVYFQHNTDNNPLSLLITSRVIYEEARAVFYSKNEFLFARTDAIPIFLIGIGQANAMFLRSVRWWCAASQQRYVNQISIIRPYILGIDGQNPTSNDKLNIWNDHPTYVNFLQKIGWKSCIEPLPEPHRLLRWNPNDSSRTKRKRHLLRIEFSDDTNNGLQAYGRWSIFNIWLRRHHRLGSASARARATYELISHVEEGDR